jgi:ATP-dependent DNA helicase RecG
LKAIVKNSGFGSKNLGIGDKNLGIDGENLGIAQLKSAILDAKLNASVRDKILQLVNEIQINQVFGAGDIVDILKCAPATATNLIKRMKTLNIVEPVVGAGKGKYVLRRAK